MSERHYKNPYSASASAGRWNPNGSRMIYAASDPAVALLEYLCIKGSAVAKTDWYMIVFEIKDESLLGELEVSTLSSDWSVVPHGRATQEMGQIWLSEAEFPFLKVPSARLNIKFYPLQFNVLINPDFPGIRKLLTVVETIPFHYLVNHGT